MKKTAPPPLAWWRNRCATGAFCWSACWAWGCSGCCCITAGSWRHGSRRRCWLWCWGSALCMGRYTFPSPNTASGTTMQTMCSRPGANAVLPDDVFYRLDAYDSYNNLGLWLDKSCIQFFNSTVAPSILEFYPTVGVKRDVNSKPEASLYALRGLLSVRYTLVPKEKVEDWEKESSLSQY